MIQKAQSIAGSLAADIIAGRFAPGDPVPSVRELAGLTGCSPGTAARAHTLLRRAGVISGAPRTQAVVSNDGHERAIALRVDPGVLRLAGSDDPALDLLLGAVGPAVERSSAGRGSVAGLGQLARGDVDAAAVHLRDAQTGRPNDIFARRLLGGAPATIVHLWRREQGIVVAKSNPLGVGGVSDLGSARLAWRQPGTGSRLLLTKLLREAGVMSRPDDGEICDSHLAVAVAVATGAVDAGLAVRAVAEAVDADFVSVENEDFEIAVAPDAMNLVAPVLEVLATTAIHDRLSAFAGYDLRRSGEVRVAA